jgi:hypothetical protein
VNATIASKICADDERKKFFGPNAHAFIMISKTKKINRLKLMSAMANVLVTKSL